MKTLNRTILIIDNEICKTRKLKTSLQAFGYKVKAVENWQQANYYLKSHTVHVLISDLDTDQISGTGLIEETLNIDSSIGIIFIATNSDIKSVVKVMKLGALDYFEKSFLMEELLFAIEKAIERKELIEENNSLRNKVKESRQYGGIVYNSEKMEAIISVIDRIAESNATVLLMGESGVGKEVMAKMIHTKSMRKDKRFVVINCAAIPENLIESELFGHEKGSFTGASYRKIGKFEQAEGGTVFLDEMAELSLDMQVKFLRVLQERQVERVGSSNSIKVDVRIIAATNRDLSKELEKGSFREDLYYRVNVVKIDIPPLRERKEDIGPMVKTFLHEFSRDYEKDLKLVDIEAMHILLNHTWKGNVRELKNAIERSVVIAKKNEEVLTKHHLPIEISNNKNFIEGRGRTEITLKEYEKLIIIDTLNKVHGSKTKAAEILDIRRQTLYNKIREYNITL